MSNKSKQSLFIYISIIIFPIIWVIYPPYNSLGQNEITNNSVTAIDSIDAFPDDSLKTIRNKTKTLTKSLKAKQEKGLKLAEEANKVSKNKKLKVHIIKLETESGQVLTKEPDNTNPIIVTSDSTYKPLKEDKPSFWKRIFGKKTKQDEKN